MSYRHKGKFISKLQAIQLGMVKEVPALSNLIASVSAKEETAMIKRINNALVSRIAFETDKNPNSSLVNLRRVDQYMRDNKELARFLCAVGGDPEVMLNRTRQYGSRSDLKGLMKLKLLVDFVYGKTKQFNRTDLALFALTIIAANKGLGWISNAELELVLLNVDPASLPKEVREAIADYKHKFMGVADARPEACRWRTTYDNLGCYYFSNEDQDDANRNGVLIQMDSPIIRHLNEAWQLG